MRSFMVAMLALVLAVPVGAGAEDRPIGDTTVFARVGDPGMPEGIAVTPDGGSVWVGTHTSLRGNAGEGPSKLFRYDLATGDLVEEVTVEGQALDATHGVLSMAYDADGRLYVLDRNPPRLLRFTFTGEETVQETYATFPDLPACPTGGPDCSPAVRDYAPFPDYFAFGPDGSAYVTDLEQAAIFRVRPGGGDAEVWFADARLDSIFGPNGIALDPSGETLYFAMTSSFQPTSPGQGIIYTLPLQTEPPSPDDLGTFFTYLEPATGPDGIAFGASGDLYVALAGSNQLSIIAPDGTEKARFPEPEEAAERALSEVLPTTDGPRTPYDLPASVAFDGEGSLLLTNQSFFQANPDHWVVFDVWVDDTALPLVRPEIP